MRPVGELREPATSRRPRPSGPRARARRRSRARAGTRPRAARVRSVSQARYRSAVTSANPSVIATNAVPKRVPPASGDEVAVEEVDERKLQRVLGPQQEREDPDLDRADRADADEPVEAPLGPRRQRAAHDQQAEPEPADQRARARGSTASGRCAPRSSARTRRTPGSPAGARCRTPNVKTPATTWLSAETTRQRTVYAAAREAVRPAPSRSGWSVPGFDCPGDDAPLRRVDGDGVRQRVDALVEPEQHDLRRARQALGERRASSASASRARDATAGNASATPTQVTDCYLEAPHRCGSPASGERWPKIGATSRSQ